MFTNTFHVHYFTEKCTIALIRALIVDTYMSIELLT